MTRHISFTVPGKPVPKQSYRAVKGGGYTDPRMKAWEKTVAQYAHLVMHGTDILAGPLRVSLYFMLPDRRRRDLDNLSKGTLDGMRGIVYEDDSQITHLELDKSFEGLGVVINVWEDG